MLPDIVTSIYHHWSEGETEKAEAAQMELQPLRDTFRLGTIPSALKKAVGLYSIPVGPPKAPVQELAGSALLEVEKWSLTINQNREVSRMPANYQFRTADHIVAGEHSIRRLKDHVRTIVPKADRALIITQPSIVKLGAIGEVQAQLTEIGIQSDVCTAILPEPTAQKY